MDYDGLFKKKWVKNEKYLPFFDSLVRCHPSKRQANPSMLKNSF
jgi:hypothetical protein